MKTVYEDKSVVIDFNGVLYLAKNRWFSTQYLGSGKTPKEAELDMEKTINKLGLKPRGYMYE